jgi:hypothetical protein
MQEALLTQRRPDGKRERVWEIVNRNLNMTANEIVLFVHYAMVGTKFHAALKFLFWNKSAPGSLDVKAERRVAML